MSIFSRKKEEGGVVAIFDIGTGSVGYALVEVRGGEDTPPKILFSSRHKIPFERHFEFSRFMKGMTRAIESCAKDLENQKPGKISNIHCFLTSPWYASQTRVIKLSKTTPFIFTQKLAESLVEKEIKLFEESTVSKYAEMGEEMVIIENKNIEVSMNGYKIVAPVGQKCKDLEMSTFISIAPESIISQISETLDHYFHSKIKFSSFIFASYVVCRDLFISENNFILIDVSAEITDVAIIKNDILIESFSFPIGKNFLIRRIASGMAVSHEEALSYLKMCSEGHEGKDISSKLSLVLERAKSEWTKSMKEALSSMSQSISIPKRAFLSADADALCWFGEALSHGEWSDILSTQSNFEVLNINEKSFYSSCSLDAGVEHDPFLMIESIYKSRQNK